MTDGMLFTGKTVEDAVADGLRSLGLTQDQVEIEVISRGSRGLFGIGSEPAQVRLTARPAKSASNAVSAAAGQPGEQQQTRNAESTAPSTAVQTPAAPIVSESVETDTSLVQATTSDDSSAADRVASDSERQEDIVDGELTSETGVTDIGTGDEADDAEMAALAVELLSETVRLMGFDAEVVASWEDPDADNDDRYLLLNLHGRDLGALIGRRGETLGNLQYLLRLMVNQRLHQWKNIVVDVEQYRQHRAEHLMQLALRSAEQVAKTGRPLSLEPMPPNERRIIHLALRDNASVYTESSGEGERRKIQILPRRSS
jgi:spoIIIJ-associated protein